jgi:hypothetical protein
MLFRNLPFSKKYLCLIFLFFFTGCQTYTQSQQSMQKEFANAQWSAALQALEKSGLGTEERNYVLYRMEKGMIEYVSESYAEPITLWDEASRKIDDLYTVSISKTATSFMTNDTVTDYRGEAHEWVLLPIFSAIDFFAQNNINDSAVMIRRTWEVLDNLKSENEGKNTFKYDAFSYYFAGMVFEAQRDWDSALVSYQNARSNLGNQMSAPGHAQEAIVKAMGRLAEYRKRSDLLTDLKKTNPSVKWESQEKFNQMGEVYVIHEVGLSPIKVAKDFFIPGGGDRILRISFPDYRDVRYVTTSSRVSLNGSFVGQPILMENIGQMARQALEDRRLWDFAKIAARAVAKDAAAQELGEKSPLLGVAANVFGIATEVADTRSWTTLPDNIQVLRVLVPPNVDNTIEVKPLLLPAQKWSVNLRPGEKKLIRLRTVH